MIKTRLFIMDFGLRKPFGAVYNTLEDKKRRFTTMFDNRTEFFLNEYFLCDAIVGKYLDGERLFNVLAEVFGISEKTRNELFTAATGDVIKGVKSETEYKRYKRALQFAEMTNVPLGFTVAEKALIEVKGNAIKTAVKYLL